MGFYAQATLVSDAKRHGRRFRAVDILLSEYKCTIESEGGTLFARLGFNYVRGLRAAVAHTITAARAREPFTSLLALMLRVPELNKKAVAVLAELGALKWTAEGPEG